VVSIGRREEGFSVGVSFRRQYGCGERVAEIFTALGTLRSSCRYHLLRSAAKYLSDAFWSETDHEADNWP